MPALVMAALLAVSVGLGLGVYQVASRSGRAISIARRNLTRGLYSAAFDVGSLEARRTGAGAVLRTLTPERSAKQMRRLLDIAGRPDGLTMTRLLWAKLFLALGAAAVGGLWAAGSGLLSWAVVVAVVVLCYHVPEIVMWGRGQERQKAIAHELPDVLDQMTIAVDAGLGFEAALARAASTGKGVLGQELVRTLQDVTVGRPRREAYNALVRRTQVTDLKRFVHAINQADSYGIAISDVLRVQAADMRMRRRLNAEEQAMKVPVKVTFPLMVCILPALLIVVVGPAFMGLGSVLG